MSAIIGSNSSEATRRAEWDQLEPHYQSVAVSLHRMAEGKVPPKPMMAGSAYITQALAMQKQGVTIK